MGVHSHLDHQLWTTCSENGKGLKRSFLSAQSCLVNGNFSSTIIHPTWWYKRRPTECKIPAEKVLQVYSVEVLFTVFSSLSGQFMICNRQWWTILPLLIIKETLVFNHSSPGLNFCSCFVLRRQGLVYDHSFYDILNAFLCLCVRVYPHLQIKQVRLPI